MFPLLLAAAASAQPQLHFDDATEAAGLANLNAARVLFVDLDRDGRPDLVVTESERRRVFLNKPSEERPGFRFVEVNGHGLPTAAPGDSLIFADFDNDGYADAIFSRYLDLNNDKFRPPPPPERLSYLRGRGNGTFEEPIAIEAAQRATTVSIAVGDVNRDGLLDLWIGNWYTRYGESLEAYSNDLLFQSRDSMGNITFVRQPLPTDVERFDEDRDAGGRPTYGTMILSPLSADRGVSLLELNYGRRWNRLLEWSSPAGGPGGVWMDRAPALGLDGDDIRDGAYPAWLKERARTDPRFDRADEKPFRANGNTFDAAVGDIDGDGRFDLFLAEITHGWAGPSSDRSRFLLNTPGRFVTPPSLSVDRVPPDPTVVNWNQGDLYAELADFDLDGRLDLLLASSDYPDNQRLRLWRQQQDGRFVDVSAWAGLLHEGAQQISLADVDGDGDMDIIVGQSFNRLSAAQIAGRTPRVRLFLNQASQRRASSGLRENWIALKLEGDPLLRVARDALGAIVRVTTTHDGVTRTQSRMLVGVGGHAGKQHEFLVHFGLGEAARADLVEIIWPAPGSIVTRLHDVPPGRRLIRLADAPGTEGR